ncbi:helix-turn-helix transcriptional regulator [Solihabitans fulvus]|uniref:Helix-turn-helix transcriptional regulator n=1 Tax=Solihabitans fulvus TaxID=1892852 RepID=A0A5B2W498_9PSEU|nr:metalloregulator ArsR/SmtB family transcription factor [Solihabitans fulvus]KAA2246763.1 helix-turn-helix transcriptional regulator [Solihabitans fulvus]
MQTVRLADIAAVLADPSRATMCLALIDGRAWTVGELGRAAGIAPSTASEHVGVLTDAGFVNTLKQGRHRYVRIDDPRVAELIERLAEHAEHQPATGLRSSVRARRLALARTCYDHLAGALGVAIRTGLINTGLVDTASGLALTDTGHRTLRDLGIDLPDTGHRRPLLRDCLDWTERREHLSGAVPAALLDHAVDRGWLDRDQHRAIRINDTATEPFARLGVDLTTLHPTAP